MSDMYAIKGSTLTALGDAVRSKTSKYISVDECPENPIFEIELDTSTFETYLYDDGFGFNFYYETQIDFKELLGDMYDKTQRLYCSYEFETNNGNKYVVWIQSRPSFEDRSNPKNNVLVSNSNKELNGNGSLFIDLPTNYYNTITASRGTFSSTEEDEIKIKVKFWACNSNNEFIVLNKYTPLEMADAINEFSVIPDDAFVLTGDCKYRFGGGWDWFLELYGDKITTKDITDVNSMFQYSNVSNIPFDINIKSGTTINLNSPFYGCKYLTSLPKFNNCKPSAMGNLFQNCYCLREIPDDYGANWDWSAIDGATSAYTGSMSGMFQSCYSLRKLPKELVKHYNPNATYSYLPYYNLAYSCYALDEIVDLPACENRLTSNAFYGTVGYSSRVKDFIFQVNEDGTPFVRQWKNQTLDFSSVGYYSSGLGYLTNYNSGITADKEVKDDATYQALKNDPDWYTTDTNYSRYNHDSAVNTINSLPDCSATGTNTIKFKGTAGSLTDGGAINTLTEEEIAVATAKGWTVSLVA